MLLKLRYTIDKMAKPTATSAAATAMIKNTNTCPDASLCNVENATNNKLTAFNISSIHIKTMMAFRLAITPTAPIMNNTALSIM